MFHHNCSGPNAPYTHTSCHRYHCSPTKRYNYKDTGIRMQPNLHSRHHYVCVCVHVQKQGEYVLSKKSCQTICLNTSYVFCLTSSHHLLWRATPFYLTCTTTRHLESVCSTSGREFEVRGAFAFSKGTPIFSESLGAIPSPQQPQEPTHLLSFSFVFSLPSFSLQTSFLLSSSCPDVSALI